MKVVQINAIYPNGSTGRIVKDIHNALKREGHETYVFSSLINKSVCDNSVKPIGTTLDHKIHALLWRIDKKQGFHSTFATKKLCKEIKSITPDVVHLHNLHSNYINLKVLLKSLAKNKTPVLITLHDCWFFTGGCMHYLNSNCDKWQKDCSSCPNRRHPKSAKNLLELKKGLYENLDFLAFNGVSRWTTTAGKNSILSVAKYSSTIYNWIDTSTFHQRTNTEQIRKKYGLKKEEKVVLGVSQGWSDNKGLKEFKTLAKDLNSKVKVLLVGEKGENIDEGNLKFLGTKTQEELIELYSIADVFVNPSKMETFGLVTIEAMACGAPVVAYDNTGSSEIVTKDCGFLVETNNYLKLLSAIKTVLEIGKENYSNKCIERVKNNFEKDKQVGLYLETYKKIIDLQTIKG